jgi:hypothetical protein
MYVHYCGATSGPPPIGSFGVAGNLSSRYAVGFVVSAVSLLRLYGRQEYTNGFSK